MSASLLLQAVFAGVTNGFVYGLVGIGLAAIFKGSRIINVMQGDCAVVGAITTVLLLTVARWPYWLAMLAGARLAVVQHLRVLVEHAADAVAAVLAHDREALLLDVALDRVADVAQVTPGPDRADAAPHRIEGNFRQPLGLYRRSSDRVHPARVAVVTVLDDRDVDVDDVAIS